MTGLSELTILKKTKEKKNPIWKSDWTASNVLTKQRKNDNILLCIHTIYVHKMQIEVYAWQSQKILLLCSQVG